MAWAQVPMNPMNPNGSTRDQYGNQIDPALQPDNLDSANVDIQSLPPKLYMWTLSETLGERIMIPADTASLNFQSTNLVEMGIHYMRENLEKQLNIQELAARLGFSASYFSASFRKQTGHSPLTYFNLLKIQQACQLLDTTDMKINQISYKMGFDDSFYFSRLFTKMMGMSPKEYRGKKKG